MAYVLETIRARTQVLHTRLEAHLDLPHQLSSPALYTRLLARYLGLYRPIEALIAVQPASLHTAIGWPDRRRVPLLESDLLALGLTENAIQNLSTYTFPPGLHQPDAIWGALYVLEGSNLGGQIIYRQIHESLGFDQHTGAAFFFGDGPATGPHWKRFLAALESNVTHPEDAASAASTMFQHFEHWLTSAS